MTGPTRNTEKDDVAETPGSETAFRQAPDDPFGFGQWMKDMPKVPLHPLMQHPAAAMAAATAIGLSMTGQIAGIMLGAMQGMTEGVRRPQDDVVADEPVEVAQAGPEARPEPAVVLPMTPKHAVQAAPVARAKTARKPKVTVNPQDAAADDLKQISGIGPKLEQVLNGMGVRRYAEIAAWTDKDIARVDGQLGFAGRIARDGWVGQAETLLKGGK